MCSAWNSKIFFWNFSILQFFTKYSFDLQTGEGRRYSIDKAAKYFERTDRPTQYHSIIYRDDEINHRKWRVKRFGFAVFNWKSSVALLGRGWLEFENLVKLGIFFKPTRVALIGKLILKKKLSLWNWKKNSKKFFPKIFIYSYSFIMENSTKIHPERIQIVNLYF